MSFTYACKAGVFDGSARCRKAADTCDVHSRLLKINKCQIAPRPDAILFKVNVNEKWEAAFRAVGLLISERTFERAQELELDRIDEAEAMGRNAYAIRESSGRNQGTPESADTGCPVFGKLGLANMNVSVRGVILEIERAGYILTGAHLLKRKHKPPVRLVMEFSRKGAKPHFQNFPWITFWHLLQTTFNQVDVWANDRKPKSKRVVHTVNCGMRDDKAVPKFRLFYAGGDWRVEENPTVESVLLETLSVMATESM